MRLGVWMVWLRLYTVFSVLELPIDIKRWTVHTTMPARLYEGAFRDCKPVQVPSRDTINETTLRATLPAT